MIPNRHKRLGSIVFHNDLLKSPLWGRCEEALMQSGYVEKRRKPFGPDETEIFYLSMWFGKGDFQSYRRFYFDTYGDGTVLHISTQPILMT